MATQPQQVSQAWDVPGKDGTVAVTQAPNSSIPSKSFSIHSNSANPVHSEIPFHPPHLHSTLSNTADQHPSMESNESMSDLPLTSSHHHSILGNPADQSMSNLPLTSLHPHSTLGDPVEYMDFSWLETDPLDPFCLSGSLGGDLATPAGALHVDAVGDAFPPGDGSMSNLPLTPLHPHSTLGDPVDQNMDFYLLETDQVDPFCIPSPIGQPASGSLGGDLTTPAGALHVDAVGDAFPPGDGSHVHISPVPNRAVLEDEDGSMEDRPHVVVGHGASSSATGPDDCLHLKSAQGFIQPDTDEVGYPGPSPPGIHADSCTLQARMELIRHIRRRLLGKEHLECQSWLSDCELSDYDFSRRSEWKWWTDNFVHPQEPPASRRTYITRFQASLEGDKPKAGYWKEKEVKAIHDPSAPKNIIGLKRTLEYMNGNKRKNLLAAEYVAVEPCGDGDVQIREEIAVRTIYEEDRETAPPSKCSKTCAHCHSSGGSFIWQHMTKVFVKGEAGSEKSLLYAICHDCDKALKCPPKFGTSNLNKHLGNDHGIHSPCKGKGGVLRRSVLRDESKL